MKNIVCVLLLAATPVFSFGADSSDCSSYKASRDKVVCSVAKLKELEAESSRLYLLARSHHKEDRMIIDLIDQTKEFWDYQARQTCMARSSHADTTGQYQSLKCAVQQASFRLNDLVLYLNEAGINNIRGE